VSHQRHNLPLSDRVATVLAIWFGCGLVPKAPGTAGTLGAIPLFWLLAKAGPVALLIAAAAVTAVGIWAADRVERRLGKKDPQIVCIDEVAGVLFTWVAAPPTLMGCAAGIVLFRLFDQFKPWPARRIDRTMKGGLGIVLDDVAAGLWGAGVLLALRLAHVIPT
jgi:phosphatidylglycerophosphatase A